MKLSFASLFAIVLIAGFVLAGCGSSETVSKPDTTPPMAPIVEGALGNQNAVGIWWEPNTEPDLAGYNVYATQAGQTVKINTQLINGTSATFCPDNMGMVRLHVTAMDWSGNESSASACKTVQFGTKHDGRDPIEGHEKQ